MRHRGRPLRARTRGWGFARFVSAAAAALALTACSVPGVFVAEKKGAAGANGFQAGSWADTSWSKTVVPTVTSKAVDLVKVLDAIKANPASASTTYGVRVSDGGTYSFPVKGAGEVVGLQEPTGQGVLALRIDGIPSDVQVGIAVGPVFLGTALRDAAHIEFGQFTNQTDYLTAALEINKEVPKHVTKGLDLAGMKGKTVSFVGAFQLLDPKNIVITPVSLEAK